MAEYFIERENPRIVLRDGVILYRGPSSECARWIYVHADAGDTFHVRRDDGGLFTANVGEDRKRHVILYRHHVGDGMDKKTFETRT